MTSSVVTSVTRSSLRLLQSTSRLEVKVNQSTAASAANLKYQADLDAIKQVDINLYPIISDTLYLSGRNMEDRACYHQHSEHQCQCSGFQGSHPQLLCQQLPGTVQPP